eukprot:c24294_g1_i1 orf=545-2815(-)
MTRPLHRGSSIGRIPDSRWSVDDSTLKVEVKGRISENYSLQGHNSPIPSKSLHLWMKRTDQNYPSLGLLKNSQKPHQRSSENGLRPNLRAQENAVPLVDAHLLKSSVGSSMNNNTLLSQCMEVCLHSQASIPNSSLSTPGSTRNRRGLALQCIMLCFVSVLVLVGVLGSTSSSYSISTSPKLELYKTYRRLQLEVSLDFSNGGIFNLGTVRPKEIEVCPRNMENYVPCYNVTAGIENGLKKGEEYDRHCEFLGKAKQCLIRPPKEYRIPLRWPASRDVVWSGNVKVTKDQLLATGSRTKRLMLVEENLITFQSENAQITEGVENYAHQIATMIGLGNDSTFYQAGVRIILDVGCGFGSFGAYLFSRNLLTLCVAPYEIQGSQAQFALERGLPAMIGSFITKQLPYPLASFDMIHCADCAIDWSHKDGILLMEVNRILRPGGYFVWTSALANPGETLLSDDDQKKRKIIENITDNICWDLLSQQEHTVIWTKKSNQACYASWGLDAKQTICEKVQDVESSWYRPLRSCIEVETNSRASAELQAFLPELQALPSEGFLNKGFLIEELSGDLGVWSAMVKNYWSLLTPLIFSDHPKRPGEDDPSPPSNMVRNVMDMNAVFGSFNAALLQAGKFTWVMNVVPTSGINTLPAIYRRGFIGAMHDWCEAFPTYPRTYDLLHAIGLLSQEAERPNGCGFSSLFLEMERILRPEGWVLLRDKTELIEDARVAATQMRWESRVVEVEGDSDLRLLVCQKNFWKDN